MQSSGEAEGAGQRTREVSRPGRWLAGLAPVLLIIVVAGVGGLAWAAEQDAGVFAGRVTRGEDGLPGVTVTAVGPVTAQAVTILDGTYRLSGLPAGDYVVPLTQDGLHGKPASRRVILQDQEIGKLDFEPVPVIAALPTVRLTTSATTAHPGDTITLRMTLAPGVQEPFADLYLVSVAPGLPVPPPMPWQSNLLVPFVSDVVAATHTFTGTEAPGTYLWLAFLTRPGTQEVLGPVASAFVTFQP